MLKLAFREPEVQRYEPATLCAFPSTIVVFGLKGVGPLDLGVALSPLNPFEDERRVEDRVTFLMILATALYSEFFPAD